jgi:pimeloyl-ACP methyl ester carboxylesterase
MTPSRRRRTGALLSFALLVANLFASPGPVAANEATIVADMQAFFATADPGRRAALATRAQADPVFRRERVGEWLHRLALHRPLKPGLVELRVPVGYGQVRSVTLRLPRGYDPSRPWPLLYALHPSGGNGPFFLDYVEKQLLGPRVEQFVLAAPTEYHQTGLDAPPPFTVDHLAILRAVRQAVHVDGDRVYALGYSLGGYAAWAVACLHADQLAGAVPISSAFCIPPSEDGLWRTMLPDFAHVPVLNVWGAQDALEVLGVRGPESLGGIAALNERLVQWARGMRLPLWKNFEIPGRGHGGAMPPPEALSELLASRREHYPKQVEHNFRHLHQGSSYWLEADTWEGAHWGGDLPTYSKRPGESEDQAFGRAVRELLGHLRGEIAGQTLKVDRRHVGEMTVWVGEGMIDWRRPVTVEVAGRRAFSGTLTPDLLVCLEQAARTLDFDRLRWAGIRIDPRGKGEPVTGRTAFPPLLPGS